MILCCGEALIDMLPRPTAEGENGYVPHAGGAIFNTAIALGRLGVPTGFFTGLADDMMGQLFLHRIAQIAQDRRMQIAVSGMAENSDGQSVAA